MLALASSISQLSCFRCSFLTMHVIYRSVALDCHNLTVVLDQGGQKMYLRPHEGPLKEINMFQRVALHKSLKIHEVGLVVVHLDDFIVL